MADLELTYAGGDYWDRSRPIIDGVVKPEGITVRYTIHQGDNELFRRVAQEAEFDAAEMSSSTYINLYSRGDRRYTAIPVFPSRNFRHSYIYLRGDSDIHLPADLKGKNVGVTEYQMTAALWQRAAMMDEYGVAPGAMRWFEGGLAKPGHNRRNPIPNPPGVDITPLTESQFLTAMLANGELDALFGVAGTPAGLYDGSGQVRRLFPNWVEVEQDYYRRTGFFPIMHLVVLRTSIYESNPWVATSLLDAFSRAQEAGWQQLKATGTLSVMLPWLNRDIEDIRSVMGGGPHHWAYGFDANYKILDYMCLQSFRQGLSDRRLQPEELFASATHAFNLPVNRTDQ